MYFFLNATRFRHVSATKMNNHVSIVAHGVNAVGCPQSERWKNIFHVHCTDRVTVAAYRCIEKDKFD